MSVYEGSRYATAPVIRTRAADGRVYPTIYAVPGGGASRYTNYVAQAGDRLDLIAHRAWGDPELWWKIAAMNPEVFYPGKIPQGTVLRIPA